MKTYLQFIVETALRPAELLKPNSQTGEMRLDILAQKIKNDDLLELAPEYARKVNGAQFKVTDKEAALQAIQQFKDQPRKTPIELTGTINGKTVTITTSNLEKTKDFGGGVGGAGAGTSDTALAEAAQCVYLAAGLNGITIDNMQDFSKAAGSKNCKISGDFAEIWQFLEAKPRWKNSSALIADLLIKQGTVTKQHVLHYDTPEVKAIYAKMSKAYKNTGKPTVKPDKWNPADIWAMAPDFNPAELDDTDVMNLKGSMQEAFEAKKCIGLSLKAVVKSPKAEVYNYNSAVGDHKFRSVAARAPKGGFFTSKNGYAFYDEGVFEILPNAYCASNKMELKLKTARGGGIGWQAIAYYAQVVGGYNLMSHKEIVALATAATQELMNPEGGDRALKQVYQLFNAAESMSYDDMIAGLKTRGDKVQGYICAKLGTCLVFDMFAKVSKKDDLMTSLVNHAASKLVESTVFIKVYE